MTVVAEPRTSNRPALAVIAWGQLSLSEMAKLLRWLLPVLSVAEAAEQLAALQREVPPESVRAVLDSLRSQLDATAWTRLTRAAGISPQPQSAAA